jgi:hypothetical protein
MHAAFICVTIIFIARRATAYTAAEVSGFTMTAAGLFIHFIHVAIEFIEDSLNVIHGKERLTTINGTVNGPIAQFMP